MLSKACDVYRAEVGDDALKVWQDAVSSKYNAYQIERAFDEHFSDSEFFPKPSNIIDRIQLADVQYPALTDGDECPRCKSTGWIYLSEAELKELGTTNEHVKKCYCGKSKGRYKPTPRQLKEYGEAVDSPEALKFKELLERIGRGMKIDSEMSEKERQARNELLKRQAAEKQGK